MVKRRVGSTQKNIMRPQNILVVDPDPAFCDLLRLALSIEGFFVSTESDIHSAAERVPASWPHRIVVGLDAHPSIPELLKQLRAVYGSTEILLVAGEGETLRQASALGCSAVLQKPLDLHALHSVLGLSVA